MRGWRTVPAAGRAAARWLLFAEALRMTADAYKLDLTSADNLRSTAKSMAEDMMSFYNGDQPGGTPGLIPQPYYWWEAGALMGSLIDYWYYTGDSFYNNVTEQGLLFQVGPSNDYMPPNQTLTEGNDDQGFWGMATMTATEYNFQNPSPDKPQWLALTQAVFNTQAARWEDQDCGGGLRWQIFRWNNGFDYKNSISQACFFNIGARLARYTGNQSYADWADKTWDWMVQAKLLDPDSYYVYDGTHTNNCSSIVPYQWSYNAGAFLLGAAAMYNYTTGSRQELWRERVDGLLNGTMVFFSGNSSDVMTEVACEPVNLCDLDQQSFKAYLSRWMAATTKWAPWTYDRIKPLLETSAVAAASQCTGGSNGRMCGLKWTDNGKWDGTTGVGQQMAAMEVVLANLISITSPPVTNSTGGTSVGNAGAGGSDVGRNDPFSILDSYKPITAADRAGAAILTVITVVALVAGMVFMIHDKNNGTPDADRWAAMKPVPVTGGGVAALRRKRTRLRKSGTFNDPNGKMAEQRDGDGVYNEKRGSMVDGRAPPFEAPPPVPPKPTMAEEMYMTPPPPPPHAHRATLSEPPLRIPRKPLPPAPPANWDQHRQSYPAAGWNSGGAPAGMTAAVAADGSRKRNSLRKKAARNSAVVAQRRDDIYA